MAFEEHVLKHEKLLAKAMAMGGAEKLARRKAAGILNARERVDYLVDQGSFEESGLFLTSQMATMRDKTPGDGKVAGFARVDGRPVGLVSNDFTVAGASSTPNNSKKMGHIKEVATKRGFPAIFLGESSGSRMPDVMGAIGMAGLDTNVYLRTRETPWVNAVLGSAFGSSAWYACMSDFNVMRKGAVMAVSSASLVSLATGGEVDPEALGGWKLHSDVTGIADMVVDTDQEALDAIKKFLSYLPSHHNEAPPRLPVVEGSDEGVKNILDLIPEQRTKVYDVRIVVKAIVDLNSYFELKARFGRTVVTSLARIDGRSVGIIANNPLYKGGAPDSDACEKITSFIVLCDSFNIPLVFLIDQPGFLIGIEAERKKMPGKVINWMNALALCTVPKISVLLRKTYGQGYLNMGGGKNSDEMAAWWTGEVSFMDPNFAVRIVHGISQKDDPELYQQLFNKMQLETSAYESASVYSVNKVIDPRETRAYLARMLDVHELRLTGGVGQHRMRTWPTTY